MNIVNNKKKIELLVWANLMYLQLSFYFFKGFFFRKKEKENRKKRD